MAIVAASPDILGGQSVQAAHLVSGLRGDGISVEWLRIDARFPKGLGWLRRVPYARTLLNQAIYVPGLARLAHVDVVHAFSASYWSFLISSVPALLAGRLFGKRVLLHYHSGEAADHLANWGWLVHPWLTLPDEIVVPSAYLQDVFAAHGYTVCVVPNVVETSRFRFRLRRPLRPRLLSARNFEPHYRVDVVMDAFQRIRKNHPDATLTIAGCGSQEAELRRRASSFPKDAIRFMGRVEPSHMPRVYDEADIFINASVIDNQPVSMLEAFAAGLAVVSTPTGDLAALVRDGETGTTVPPDDPDAIATAVHRLLDKPSFASAMAFRAYQEVQGFSWSAVRRQWADLYEGVS